MDRTGTGLLKLTVFVIQSLGLKVLEKVQYTKLDRDRYTLETMVKRFQITFVIGLYHLMDSKRTIYITCNLVRWLFVGRCDKI